MQSDAEAQPFNPLAAVGVVLALAAIVACGMVWSLPEPVPVDDRDAGGLGLEKWKLEAVSTAQRNQIEAVEADIARERKDLAELRAWKDAQEAKSSQVAPAEVAAMRDRIAQLNIQIETLEAEQRNAQSDAELASGRLKPEVIATVNARLAKLNVDQTHFVCATWIMGWCYTTARIQPPTSAVFGMATANTPVSTAGVRPLTHPNLTGYCFDGGGAKRTDAQRTQGFTAQEFELKPQDGQMIYCVCHQLIGDKVLDHSVVSGILAGTVTQNGHVYLKVSLPGRPEMAGAPIVTPQGKLVGLLMPKSAEVEDLNLVVPMEEILSAQNR